MAESRVPRLGLPFSRTDLGRSIASRKWQKLIRKEVRSEVDDGQSGSCRRHSRRGGSSCSIREKPQPPSALNSWQTRCVEGRTSVRCANSRPKSKIWGLRRRASDECKWSYRIMGWEQRNPTEPSRCVLGHNRTFIQWGFSGRGSEQWTQDSVRGRTGGSSLSRNEGTLAGGRWRAPLRPDCLRLEPWGLLAG